MINKLDNHLPAIVTVVMLTGLLLLACMGVAWADGTVIDKIYHPYVQPLERELELRTSIEDGKSGQFTDRQTWRLGYGMAFSDNWFGELYVIGEKDSRDSFHASQYELEALWQLTEQGEYFADWGLLFEYEIGDSDDIMEFSTALLVEKEWQRWTGTANLHLIYEFGDDIQNEFESALALQVRYRLAMKLEPAFEFYRSEDVTAAGPVLMGNWRFSNARRLHWETGLILGLDKSTPDRTFRFLLEFEF